MLKFLPTFVLVLLFYFLILGYERKEERLFQQLDNGCLVYALHFKMLLDANDRLQPHLWSRIIAIQFGGRLLGHAILVFVYKNITFVYDPAQGSYVLTAYPLYDPVTIAEITYPKLHIRSAKFIEPTITLTYP